jgi:hypothetical protein
LSKFIPLRLAKLGQTEVPDGSAILRGQMEEPNGGPDKGAKQGARQGQMEGQMEGQIGPDRARRSQTGWRTKGLFTFKRKNDMFYIRVM